MTDFISPVGRFVQGSLTLEPKKDKDGKPVIDQETGKQVMESFIAIAIRKDDPGLMPFYNLFLQTAQADFPHLFSNGQCTHPSFAWKIQDGDGVDQSGQSVANKPGFAGHYVFKMATRYAPKCFHYGKYDASQQIQNPNDVIKRGYFIRVSGTITGNGVKPDNRQARPGLYVSPNLVELIAYGEEIVSGPDPSKVFGAAPINTAALPQGASMTPMVPQGQGGAIGGGPAIGGGGPIGGPMGGPAIGGIGTPNAGVVGGPATIGGIGGPAAIGVNPQIGQGGAATSLPGGLSAGGNGGIALPGGNAMPAQNVGPQFTMQPTAQGYTREQLHAQGWTDERLINEGHMVRNW